MDIRQKYLECKKRNEQQLFNIELLETQILEVQNKIRLKKSSIKESKEAQKKYIQLIEVQRGHQKKLKKLASTNRADRKSAKPSLATGRRELTQLISTTPDMICKKVESLIEKQIKNQKPLPQEEIQQLQYLFDHLPNKSDRHQFTMIINALTEEAKRLILDESKFEKEDIKDSKQYQNIMDHLSSQSSRIKELTERREELELKTREAESLLAKRVREVYNDPAVQSSLTKQLRLKAANQQIQVELKATTEQIQAIHEKIQSIEDSVDTKNMENRINNMIAQAVIKQKQMQSMIATNREFTKSIESENAQTDEDGQADESELMQKVEKALSIIEQNLDQKINPTIVKQEHDKTLDIRNAISPKTLISTTQAISEIVNMIDSVNSLSKNSVVSLCADIRVQLENLCEKWETSIDKQNIPIAQSDSTDQDYIDAVIQSVDSLIVYINEKEMSYISEQKEKLQGKLIVAEKIEKEIKTARDSLNERELITKIGGDYTVQEKSFSQWLEALRIKDDSDIV